MLREYKNNVIIDSGVLLEFYELLLESINQTIMGKKKEQLFRYLEHLSGKNLYVVPQVYSELYSLLKRDADNNIPKLKDWLSKLKPYYKTLIEKFVSIEKILDDIKFLDFGFTDIALSKLIDKNNYFITIDWKLRGYCKSKGLEAYHIEEIFIM